MKQEILHLANEDLGAILHELVGGHLEVQWGRALTDAATHIVVGTVARAEPAVVVTGVADGDATKVGADTEGDEPLGVNDTVRIGLGVTELAEVDVVGVLDLSLSAVADEDGLTTPLDDSAGALSDLSKLNLEGGHSHDILGGAHGGDKLDERKTGSRSVEEASATESEVSELTAIGITLGHGVLVVLVVGSHGVHNLAAAEAGLVARDVADGRGASHVAEAKGHHFAKDDDCESIKISK